MLLLVGFGFDVNLDLEEEGDGNGNGSAQLSFIFKTSKKINVEDILVMTKKNIIPFLYQAHSGNKKNSFSFT